MKLIERVQLGDITGAQFDQLTGFFDAERLGLTDRVYKPETGLTTLEALRHIELFSVVPPDRSVEPLERFPSLETARVQGFPKAEINRFFAATNVANAFASKPEC